MKTCNTKEKVCEAVKEEARMENTDEQPLSCSFESW